MSVLNPRTYKVTTLDNSGLGNTNPSGGYFLDAKIYFTTIGNRSASNDAPGTCVFITKTYGATPILNSWFGEQFSSVNDLIWVPEYSSLPRIQATGYDVPGLSTAVLDNVVYRLPAPTQSLYGVISSGDLTIANGVRTDAKGQYIYVTGETAPFNATDSSRNSPRILGYLPLYPSCGLLPVNKRLLGTVRSYADDFTSTTMGRVDWRT